MNNRRRARELALQGLYGLEISGNAANVVKEDMVREESDKEVQDFALELFSTTVEHQQTCDAHISTALKNWDFGRVALLDRLILRMALCELLFFEEIPPKVTINEAIDLAKGFSTAQSGRFVNGILDALYQKLEGEGKINKKGRGLVKTSLRSHKS